jgi:hypothetical protein
LNSDNAGELVAFAKSHSAREIEREVRRRNPKAAVHSKIKALTGDSDELRAAIPTAASENIRRAQALLARKYGEHPDLSKTIELVFADFVEESRVLYLR